MKKERPILFSEVMVRAVLKETDPKTKTRRTRNLEKINEKPDDWMFVAIIIDDYCDPFYRFVNKKTNEAVNINCPFGMVGDVLWVRENFNISAYSTNDDLRWIHYTHPSISEKGSATLTEAEWKKFKKWQRKEGKHPSLFMFKSMSYIFLEITSVRIERLHDITINDIVAEGVKYPVHNGNPCFLIGEENSAWSFLDDAEDLTEEKLLKAHWAELWCKINGRESWDANPWVWVVEFKKVLKERNVERNGD